MARPHPPGPKLSARQPAVPLTAYTVAPPHTVVALAAAFGVPRQAVSRAVAALERHGLFVTEDRRVGLVQRTVKGAVYLSDLADVIATRGHA